MQFPTMIRNNEHNQLIAVYIPFAISYSQIYSQDTFKWISSTLTMYHNARVLLYTVYYCRHCIMNHCSFPVKEIMAATSKKCISGSFGESVVCICVTGLGVSPWCGVLIRVIITLFL